MSEKSREPKATGSDTQRARRRNLHTTLSCMLVYLAIHHALEGAGPCQKTWCDSPHLHSFWSIAPPEASTVHVVCLVEGHPNGPSSKRSKRDCGPRVSRCPKHVRCVQLRRSCQIVVKFLLVRKRGVGQLNSCAEPSKFRTVACYIAWSLRGRKH